MSRALPSGWETKKIGDIATVFSGGTPDRTNPDFYKGKNPWVKSGEINSRKIRNTEEHISDAAIEQSSAKWVPNGAVLVAMYGATAGKVAKLMIDATLNQAISAVIVKDDSSHNNYLFHSLDFNSEELLKSLQGSGQPNLSGGLIKGLTILHPPLAEQQKIAAILTAVDDLIESTQAQINKLKDLKTGMMQELLTKGIGHTEFKDSPVGRIPLNWQLQPLELIIEKIVDCEHKTAPYVEKSEYIVVRTNNVKSGQLIFDDIKFTNKDGYTEWTSRLIPTEGDVLFTREAPAGESCMVPKNIKLCMGQRMVLLRPNKSHINGEYFSIYLNSQTAINSIFRFSIGTTVSRINIEDIRRIPCIVPPLDEQNKIAGCINSIQNSIRVLENKLQSNLNEKKALMQDLLTGKTRVRIDT